ncbi:hypothetical protein [Hymenobacter chitinivorans]|uniref:Uncharacterized protein n=1 Tax=Hymenobacter chitinivorans DSM 11115 TaxID=1121954 RepID=A0A2M9AQC7_9BACT|nr:hypothetical protein [Hymenobacter chitinivorans]PJJ47907.1 hypothetical protein CLV45_4597 [Hymenobacter chitinivorans DSM 11115]
MKAEIKLAASVDQDEDCIFDVVVRKANVETHVTFFGAVDTWQSFATQLLEFPSSAAATAVFNVEGGVYRDTLLLVAYCYDAAGHTALKVSTDNHAELPDRCTMEFSIRAEAASLNKLGQLLLGWQVKHDSEIVWEAQTS